MGMARALIIASGFGGIALFLTIILIWFGHVPIRLHILTGLFTGFWNMFIQSMIMFMWISYPKQILRQLDSKRTMKEEDKNAMMRCRKKLIALSASLTLFFMAQLLLGMGSFISDFAFEVHFYFAWILLVFFAFVFLKEIQGFSHLYQIVSRVFREPKREATE